MRAPGWGAPSAGLLSSLDTPMALPLYAFG